VLGCLSFSGSAWALEARDSWIGWDPSRKAEGLRLIANNSRFLILPWAHERNLASRVLEDASSGEMPPDDPASAAARLTAEVNASAALVVDGIGLNSAGAPICAAGTLKLDGHDKGRQRTRHLCGVDACAIPRCDHYGECRFAGKTTYPGHRGNLRLNTRIPRGSEHWRLECNKRTSTERVNARVIAAAGYRGRTGTERGTSESARASRPSTSTWT
jgi:hypothetical protein